MSESTDLVVVRRFSTVPDAQMARSVVEAAGIPSELVDHNIVAANWLYSNAVDGVKLRVPNERAEEAVIALDTPAEPVDDPETPHPFGDRDSCAACGAVDVEALTQRLRWTMLTWLVFGLPLVSVRQVRRCRRCGAISKRSERAR